MKSPQTIVLFDAVGTVIRPNPGVTEVYFRFGQKHGSRLQRWEIQARIQEFREKLFGVRSATLPHSSNPVRATGPLDELESDESTERALWQSLVFNVFSELDSPNELFDDLWTYFGQHESWHVFDDVQKCWAQLREQGVLIGLASNFDSRLISIAATLNPLSSADFVFCSSQVGFRKPSQLFYQQVRSAINCIVGTTTAGLEIHMIGDDYENDCVAPRLAGWNAVWLDRTTGSDSGTSSVIPGEHRVESLDEFTRKVLNRQ